MNTDEKEEIQKEFADIGGIVGVGLSSFFHCKWKYDAHLVLQSWCQQKQILFSPLFAEPILAGAYFQDGWFNELAILSFKIVFYTPTSRMVGSRLIEIKEMSYIPLPIPSTERVALWNLQIDFL